MNLKPKDIQAFVKAAQTDLGRHVSEIEAKQIATNVIDLLVTLTSPIDSDGDVVFMEKNSQISRKSGKVIARAQNSHKREVT